LSVRVLASGCLGFLLAVLWFDLMFDVQVRAHRDGDLPDDVLASIAGYYARVTTGARPRNRLVPLVMLGAVAATIGELVGDAAPTWAVAVALTLVLTPVVVAGRSTVPSAVRLGRRTDSPAVQAATARRIYRQHRFCLACIAGALVLQIGVVR
jgi:hypothetical protein